MTDVNSPNCGKCGICLNVCPVYRQIKEEQVSPRAKMQLIKAHDEHSLSSSPYLKQIVSKCLMCGACAANCPSGIDHYAAFMKMREKMARDHGEPIPIKSLIYLLSKEYRLNLSTGLAKTGQKLLPDKIARSFSVGSIPADRMPRLNDIPFRKACATIVEPDTAVRGTVAYFTGCATNYLYDDTGFAAVNILKQMGYRVIVPKTQQCCAIPLLFHGAAKQAQKNITANIKALKDLDADAILVDCSTCGDALAHIYPSLFEAPAPAFDDAREIARKTMNILSFIDQHFNHLNLETDCGEKPVVTYHAPCHSRNRSGVHNTAEKLIKKLPCIIYKKTIDMEECCGGGGTFFYEYPDISKKMIGKKKENAKSVRATHWLTDCPVCRMNLAGTLNKEDNLTVAHPLTFIDKTMKLS